VSLQGDRYLKALQHPAHVSEMVKSPSLRKSPSELWWSGRRKSKDAAKSFVGKIISRQDHWHTGLATTHSRWVYEGGRSASQKYSLQVPFDSSKCARDILAAERGLPAMWHQGSPRSSQSHQCASTAVKGPSSRAHPGTLRGGLCQEPSPADWMLGTLTGGLTVPY